MIKIGNCIDLMAEMPDCSIDAIITDPPYELGFMNKSWDSTGIAYNTDVWSHCLRILKPGGHLLAFGGSRTYHRLAIAIEDAGFQIRDQIMWVYGSGFPKSLNISKAIDKSFGAKGEIVGYSRGVAVSAEDNQFGGINRGGVGIKQVGIDVPIVAPATAEAKEWEGWGTALKPAHEPIVLAWKSSEQDFLNKTNCSLPRFFYCAKASSSERNAGLKDMPKKKADLRSDVAAGMWKDKNAAHQNHHPTVKPVTLMRNLIKLVTPLNGTVLDPFLGSGTTAVAAIHENINWVGFEMNPEYATIANRRIEHASF